MHRLVNILTVFLTIALLGWSQSQVATVTSAAPFKLRGASVTPGQGVPSWPAVAGDLVTAENGPVTVSYLDGSSFILDPGSTAKINISGQSPVFQLQSGLARYSVKSLTSVRLMALETTVGPTKLSGILRISNGRPVLGFWTPGHTALVVVGAGAAAGLGIGVARATSGGDPVSVSR
jgi:hypothetical protein